jgi:hypothetical protein
MAALTVLENFFRILICIALVFLPFVFPVKLFYFVRTTVAIEDFVASGVICISLSHYRQPIGRALVLIQYGLLLGLFDCF